MTAAIPQGNRRTQELALPAFTLWWREIVRFYRQRARVVGVIASPVLFWIVIGSGFGKSFTSDSGTSQHYLDYFYPGALIMEGTAYDWSSIHMKNKLLASSS